MTTLIASCVVRGSRQGESHGGVYLIDFEHERVAQVVDWNRTDIDWQGRGCGRGLRGIALHDEEIFIAASDELLVYTPDFRLLASYRNPYLKHCHEIFVYQQMLFLTSTGFDSILGFDLERRRYAWGLCIATGEGGGLRGVPFRPESTRGPPAANELHLNTVYCDQRGMFVSGMRTGGLLIFTGKRIAFWARLPHGVHNARPFRDGVLFNDTEADAVRFAAPSGERIFRVPRYEPGQLTHTDPEGTGIARQAFGRGLCVIDESILAAGSSPSTIALHDLEKLQTTKIVTLSFDIRHTVHGLAVWPY